MQPELTAAPMMVAKGRTQRDLVPVTGRVLLRGATLNVLVKLTMSLAGVGVVSVLARSLGPADYGMLAVAMTIVATLGNVTELGLGTAVTREFAARPESRAQLLSGVIVIRALLMSIGLCAALAVAPFITSGSRSLAAYAIVIAALPFGLIAGLSVVSAGRLRPGLTILPSLAQTVLWTIGVILVAVARGDVRWFACAFLVSALAQAAVAAAVNLRLASVRIVGARVEVMRLLRRYWPLAGAHLLFLVYHSFDAIAVAALAGRVQVAYYAGSYRFLETMQAPALTIAGVLLPLLASLHREGRDPVQLALLGVRMLRCSLLAASSLAVAVAVGAPVLIRLIFGVAYAPMVPVLIVVAFVAAGLFVEAQLSAVILLFDRIKAQFFLSVLTAALSVGTWPFVIPRYGALGAAVVSLALQALRCVVMWVIAGRASGWPMPTRKAAAVVVASAAAVALSRLGAPAPVRMGTAATAFAVVVVLARVITARDLASLLKARGTVAA